MYLSVRVSQNNSGMLEPMVCYYIVYVVETLLALCMLVCVCVCVCVCGVCVGVVYPAGLWSCFYIDRKWRNPRKSEPGKADGILHREP